jgi:type II secretion system protein I
MKPKTGKTGFTLVELLLSVAILSFGLVGVIHAYGISLKALSVGQDYSDFIYLLSKRMAEVEEKTLVEGGINSGTSYGEFSDGYANFNWRLQVEEAATKGLQKVLVTVSHQKDPRTFTLATYLMESPDEEE